MPELQESYELDKYYEDWWVIKNPKGVLLPITASREEQTCKDWFVKEKANKPDMGWSYFQALGYSCVRIKIQEYLVKETIKV